MRSRVLRVALFRRFFYARAPHNIGGGAAAAVATLLENLRPFGYSLQLWLALGCHSFGESLKQRPEAFVIGQRRGLASEHPANLPLLDLWPGLEPSRHREGKQGDLTDDDTPILVDLLIVGEMPNGLVANDSPYPGFLKCFAGR